MIRQLRPGEPIPTTPPRRYKASQGYVRLRWRVGTRRYVETYEHRVVEGRVTTAPQVHHRNHQRDDNRHENLAPVTTAEHGEHHRTVDRERVVELYRSGLTLPQVAEVMAIDHGHASRILAAEGVKARTAEDYYLTIPRETFLAAAAQAQSAGDLARHFGLTRGPTRRLMRQHGVRPWPLGSKRRNRVER